MRISDWSSDVCSSDLFNHRKLLRGFFEGQGIEGERQMLVLRELDKLDKRGEEAVAATLAGEGFGLASDVISRLMAFSSSKERRVGKEWVRTCQSRWSTYH